MSVPGINLLGLAMTAIGQQTPTVYKFVSRATNAAGIDVPTYAAGVPVSGSLQAVPTRDYERLGLNWDETYVMFYTPYQLITVARDGSGDRLVYGGLHYVCESMTDWQQQDGWNAVLAVNVPPLAV